MANYGLEVKNENGDTLLDSLHSNFCIQQMGSAVPVNSGGYISYYVDVPITPKIPVANGPLFLINNLSSTGGHGFGGYIQSNGYITSARIWGNQNDTFNYAIATIANYNTSTSELYGLANYASNGTKIFDSRYKQLLIRDIQTFTISSRGQNVTVNHAAVTNPYFVASAISGMSTVDMPYQTIASLSCAKSQTTTSAAIWDMPIAIYASQHLGNTFEYPANQRFVVCNISV